MVHDDDNHQFRRGERIAVCSKTYKILTSEPYTSHMIGIEPYTTIPESEQKPYSCHGPTIRPASVTKNGPLPATTADVSACTKGSCC